MPDMDVKQFNWKKWVPGLKSKEKEEIKVPISNKKTKEKKKFSTDFIKGATKKELDWL